MRVSTLRTTAIVLLVAACSTASAETAPTTVAAAPSTTTTAPSTTTTTTVPPTTTTTAAPSAPAEPERGRLVIHAVGDTDFTLPSTARAVAAEGYDYPWTGLRGIFQRDDLTIVNLECAPTDIGYPIPKEWNLICPVESLDPMRAAGVDATNMANNHAGDMGKEALVDGRKNLLEHGFLAFGAGKDLAEADQPAIVDIDGWTIALVGFSHISGNGRWFAGEEFPGVAPATLENIEASVSAAAEQADIVIVMVHWGVELAPGPTGGDRERARVMIEAGADVIVGHHPHRLQPFEVVDGVPVFWSMGNFIWPNLGPIQATTGVAEIVIEPDGTITGRLIPAYIERHARPVLRGSPDPSLIPERPGVV